MSQGNPTQHEIDIYCGEWILNGGDQSKAWRKAYPRSAMNDEGIYVKACNMHKMDKIQLRISELQAEQADKDSQEFDLSAAELKEYLARIIKAGLEVDGNGKYAGLSASTGAVAEINRMNGNHAATKGELSGPNGQPIEVDQKWEVEFINAPTQG